MHFLDQPKIGTVLIATATPLSSETRTTELISLSSKEKMCRKIADFPHFIDGSDGGILVLNKVRYPIICGGHGTVACYVFDSTKRRWILIEGREKPRKRFRAASVVLADDKTLWRTGGQYGAITGIMLKSTELVTFDHGKSLETPFNYRAGPDLPIEIAYHCMVQVNSTTAMLIGGRNKKGYHNNTYLFDITSEDKLKHWVKGPDLSTARQWHSCGVLTNPGDGNHKVVIAAGGCCRRSSTEMWVVGSSQGWTRGPDLPSGLWGSWGVVTPDGKALLLPGGRSNEQFSSKILKLAYENGRWSWTKLDQELEVPRRNHMAFLVPDSLC